MKLVDTHTHLYTEDFKDDIDSVIERARREGVEKFFLPAIDSSETQAMLELEKKYPFLLFCMAGLHPCSVKENYKEELSLVEEQLSARKFAGIGETGLDFYWDTTYAKEQYESLRIQAGWAIKYNLPLILHTRQATDETIAVIKEFKGQNLSGIFHCFSGTPDQAKEIISLGFYLGIGGVLTFKNSGLAEIVKETDLAHIVLETDAPYLAPVPFRGKRNESSYLKYIVAMLAEIKNISEEEVASQTTANAMTVFG